ncbi:MAG: phenylacetate--CoA ligase family protein [Planctomycetota bacterium]|nr:MAG: phenylacetate--CoA ligase family protein [Planctomycetota bacterium]
MQHTLPGSDWQLPPLEECWQWSLDRLAQWQVDAFNRQLQAILPTNRFYQQKLGTNPAPIRHLDDLAQWPMTTKAELVEAAQQAPTGISPHHTFDTRYYTRLHRTSGTKGRPLVILDSETDWRWWSGTWQHVLRAAGVTPDDRVFLAFSFGPFIGFWSAHQACVDLGALAIPGGGLSSLARLEFMRQTAAAVVCCTPSYAMHLAEVAADNGFPLAELPVRILIVAGEAGGSVPEVRQHIEKAWRARLVDHSGATEIGPWGFGWPDRPGLHIIETSFIAELLPLEDTSPGRPEGPVTQFELVLTSLGRIGAPAIRYRTGDVVEAHRPTDGPCRFLWLPRGVIGRADDMVTVRGVNVFPSGIDAIVRQFPQVAEYQVRILRRGAMDELVVDAECDAETAQRLAAALHIQLGLRIPVKTVPADSLPRFEAKARRWLDHRHLPAEKS